jgi:hypothetical protein
MPKPTRLISTPDGTLALVYADGRPVPSDQRIESTAEQYLDALTAHAAAAVQVERRAAEKRLAEVAQSVAEQTAKSYAKAGVEAGAKFAAEEIAASSVVRRRVERDAKGQIVATIEERVPLPETKKGPLGFRR